jgi:LPXTG-motif cell wall-anchored protein
MMATHFASFHKRSPATAEADLTMIRRLMGLAVAALSFTAVAALTAGPALAQAGEGEDDTYAPDAACALISDITPAPGQDVTITGFIRQQGVNVIVTLVIPGVSTEELGSTVSDPVDGSFEITVTIPDDVPDGPALIQVTSDSADADACSAVLGITITSGGGELPETGSNSTRSLTQIGVSMIAAGGVLVLATRKRIAKAAA